MFLIFFLNVFGHFIWRLRIILYLCTNDSVAKDYRFVAYEHLSYGRCLSFKVLVELVFHLDGDVPQYVFDDFLNVFVHFIWRLRIILYLCRQNSIETEPWIVVPGSSFSLLFLFYVLFNFIGVVRDGV